MSCAPLDRVPATEFLPALAGVLGAGVVLAQRASLAESERAATLAAAALAPPGDGTKRWRHPSDDTRLWDRHLRSFSAGLTPVPSLYFSVRWATLGASRVAPAMILPHGAELARRGLGCLLTTEDGLAGMRLDLLEPVASEPGSVAELELIVWGASWRQTAMRATGSTSND